MAVYNQGYPATYQPMSYGMQTMPYQQSYQAPIQMQQPMQQSYSPAPVPASQQNSSGIVWVQGEAAARSYMIANGTSVLLMDSEEPVFYIKTTDSYGMPLPLKIFDYKERTTSSQKLLPGRAELIEEVPQQSRQDVDLSKYATKDEIDHKIDELYKLIDELTATKSRKERSNG